MLLSFIFSLQFLSSSLASLTPKNAEICPQTIIAKIGTGEELNPNTIESIKRNVYKLDSAKLELLQPLNENSLMLILHPCNFQGFMEDCSSVNNIKSKLSPKSFISFKINEVEITEEIQEKIFNPMEINEIADYLMNNQGFIDLGYQVFQDMTYSRIIQEIIRNRLRDIEDLPSEACKVLLSPLNEDLILSYQADQGTTLSTHIKSRLCPDNFFSLEGTFSVPKDKQQMIFKLLDLKQIVEILVENNNSMIPNYKLVDLLKEEEIIERLRDQALWQHQSKFVEILAEIEELKELPEYLGKDYIESCIELCEKIQEMFLYEKFKESFQNGNLCPDNFFPLESAGIEVSPKIQKNIFELLDLKQIVEILVKDKEAMIPNYKLVDLLKKEEIIKGLRDQVLSCHKSEVIKILAEIEELKELPEYLGKDYIESCIELCEKIQEMFLYEKFKESFQNGHLCPDNFFPLEGAGIKVSPKIQKSIFELLEFKEITEVLAWDEDAIDPNCKLVELIKKEEIIKGLRDQVVWRHKSEVIKILAKIKQLKELPEYIGENTWFIYGPLCENIQKMIANSKQNN